MSKIKHVVLTTKLLTALSFAFLSQPASCWPPERNDGEEYNHYFQRLTLNPGTINLGNGDIPYRATFEVLPDNEAYPHTTRVKARRFYMNGQTTVEVDENIIEIAHKALQPTTVKSDQFYLTNNRLLYLPNTKVTEYERPDISYLNVPFLKYTSEQESRTLQNVLALSISLDGTIVTAPQVGFYKRNTTTQHNCPFIYSSGSKLYLARIMCANCDFINFTPNYKFTYALKTGHELTVKPGCTLRIIEGNITINEPYSHLPQGLYKNTDQGWVKIRKVFGRENGKVYSIIPAGTSDTFVDKLTVDHPSGSLDEILKDVSTASTHIKIKCLDLNGLNVDKQKFTVLSAALRNWKDCLEVLNIARERNGASYNDLTQTLTTLTRLKQLHITNCGIDEAHKRQLQRDGLQLIDRTPQPQVQTQIQTRPQAIVPLQAVEPTPTLVAIIEDKFDGGTRGIHFRIAQTLGGFRAISIIYSRVIKYWSNGREDIGSFRKLTTVIATNTICSSYEQACERAREYDSYTNIHRDIRRQIERDGAL